ncbi:hypothetical protein PVAP13_9KG280300 [Panicum virgatum]|uniref:F-box domain-containing protein n=1 Tax=Panicum virgatum TaxID=38727 RepID=A0A8T0NPH5_PANVG|nr:hypothetical protein PVAP13_9KG280300 [Panicum virgatum]
MSEDRGDMTSGGKQGKSSDVVPAGSPLEDDNLLSVILCRLPSVPSSLLRASLVCKPWRFLASALTPVSSASSAPTTRSPLSSASCPSISLETSNSPKCWIHLGLHPGRTLLLAGQSGQQSPSQPPRPYPCPQPAGATTLLGVGSCHQRAAQEDACD